MTAGHSIPAGKALSQRDQILQLLRERGPAGATNIELNAIAFRYGGRIFELRRMGHKVRTENLGDGRFRFVLEAGTPRQRNELQTTGKPRPRTDVPVSPPRPPTSTQHELFAEVCA